MGQKGSVDVIERVTNITGEASSLYVHEVVPAYKLITLITLYDGGSVPFTEVVI